MNYFKLGFTQTFRHGDTRQCENVHIVGAWSALASLHNTGVEVFPVEVGRDKLNNNLPSKRALSREVRYHVIMECTTLHSLNVFKYESYITSGQSRFLLTVRHNCLMRFFLKKTWYVKWILENSVLTSLPTNLVLLLKSCSGEGGFVTKS